MRVMHILIFLMLVLVSTAYAESQKSPHGLNHKIDCATCHVTEDWKKIKENGFNHNKTKFPLTGQHKAVGCKKCHTTLKFEDAENDCASCHKDVHQGTVGRDCAYCHTTNSWIVTNTRRMHQNKGFPLVGAHASADCNRCHTSASLLRFENRRSDCYDCHKANYNATTTPNHRTAGFGTDCNRCHSMAGFDWTNSGKGFDHNAFYPLVGAHKTAECSACHWDNYSADEKADLATKKDCKSCHSPGPARTKYPAHTTKYLKYDCNACHNTISWDGVISFRQHDSWGKIYSGEHKGTWDKCTDCHNNDASYIANCSKCHSFSSGKMP